MDAYCTRATCIQTKRSELQGHLVPFVCGGEILQLPMSLIAKQGKLAPLQKEFLVIEADEFRQAFLGLSPMITVLTNVDHEHIDCYPYASSPRAMYPC